MKSSLARIGAVFAVLLASLAIGHVAAQPSFDALTADYEFQDSLASSTGDPPSLQNIGEGNVFQEEQVGGEMRTVLVFPEGSGLSLVPTLEVIPSGNYTIDLIFRFDTVSGYRRIIDFKNATSDIGLYNLNGLLNFYPGIDGIQRPFAENRWVQVTLTRDLPGTVTGYVNGVQQLAFQDAESWGVISEADTLRFFRDDNAVSAEQSGGAVARIRLYNRALSAREVAEITVLR